MSHDESTHACACGGSCGCQNSTPAQEVFLTREEYISRLERYLVELKGEIVSVEQELAELARTAEPAKA